MALHFRPSALVLLVGAIATLFPTLSVVTADSKVENEATVYILRPSPLAPTSRIWTFLDERLLGATRGGDCVVAQVPAGRRLFWSKSENIATLEVEVKTDGVYYVVQGVFQGERRPRVKLTLLSEARGQGIEASCTYRPLKEKHRTQGEAIAVENLALARSIAAEETHIGRLVDNAGRSVFRVETEDGYATGLLVDSAGLILASAGLHYAHFEESSSMGAMPTFGYASSNRIAVVLGPRRRAEAKLITYGRPFALLRIHPDLVEGLAPLKPSSRPPVKGDQLVAVCPGADGSTRWAKASVWKPQRRTSAAFYVDVRIDRRDLGCPLFDLDGGVAGTYQGQAFGDSHDPEVDQGRIALTFEPFLAGARSKAADPDLPSAELLPEAPEAEYPRELAESVMGAVDPADYIARMELVDLEFLTPPLLRKLESGDSEPWPARIIRYTPSRGFFDWKEYAGTAQAVVVIQAVPKIRKVANRPSDYWGALASLFNPSDREFEPMFERLELFRDGIPVRPIRPRRICGRFTVHASSTDGVVEWKDKLYGCYGSYAYRPEEFDPEAKLAVSLSTSEGTVQHAIPRETLQRIQDDFRSFFAKRP